MSDSPRPGRTRLQSAKLNSVTPQDSDDSDDVVPSEEEQDPVLPLPAAQAVVEPAQLDPGPPPVVQAVVGPDQGLQPVLPVLQQQLVPEEEVLQPGGMAEPVEGDLLCTEGCHIRVQGNTVGVCLRHYAVAKCDDAECVEAGTGRVRYLTKQCQNGHDVEDKGQGLSNETQSIIRALQGIGGGGTGNEDPPQFLTKPSEFRQYKKNLIRWERTTSKAKSKRADVVIMKIPTTNPYFERIHQLADSKDFTKDDGLTKFVACLEEIFGEENHLQEFSANVAFRERVKQQGETYSDFINDFEVLRMKCIENKLPCADWLCVLSLIHQSKLPNLQRSLVWTAVSNKKAELSKVKEFDRMDTKLSPLLECAYKSIRDLSSLSILDSSSRSGHYVADDNSMEGLALSEQEKQTAMEWALMQREGKASGGKAQHGTGPGTLNNRGQIRRCYNCRPGIPGKLPACSHGDRETCNCPCSNHYSPDCPYPKRETKAEKIAKAKAAKEKKEKPKKDKEDKAKEEPVQGIAKETTDSSAQQWFKTMENAGISCSGFGGFAGMVWDTDPVHSDEEDEVLPPLVQPANILQLPLINPGDWEADGLDGELLELAEEGPPGPGQLQEHSFTLAEEASQDQQQQQPLAGVGPDAPAPQLGPQLGHGTSGISDEDMMATSGSSGHTSAASRCPSCATTVSIPEAFNGSADDSDGMLPNAQYRASLEVDKGVTHIRQSLEEIVYASGEKKDMALVDSGAPSVLGGATFVLDFVMRYPPELRKKIAMSKSRRSFSFGGGESRKSMGRITLPVALRDKAGKRVAVGIRIEVVNCNFTLLLGLSFMMKARCRILIMEHELMCMNIEGLGLNEGDRGVDMPLLDSGHLGINLSHITMFEYEASGRESQAVFWARQDALLNNCIAYDGDTAANLIDAVLEQSRETTDGWGLISTFVAQLHSADTEEKLLQVCATVNTDKEAVSAGLSGSDIMKLHILFGHCDPEKLTKLLLLSGRLSERAKKGIEELRGCETCTLFKKRVPLPKFALSRTKHEIGFNMLVHLDYKVNTRYPSMPQYILYACDNFSKYTRAWFTDKKDAVTTVQTFHVGWTAVFNSPRQCHWDRGGEFLNKDWGEYCRLFNVRTSTTAAHSPHQNLIERIHALVDVRLEKIISTPGLNCDPQYALGLALSAHNNWTNTDGISPAQMVFNHPVDYMPQVDSMGPAQLEEPSRSHVVSMMRKQMEATRLAFAQSQAEVLVRKALKARIYCRAGENVEPGNWIYYREPGNRGWEGPVRVATIQGKQLWCIKEGRNICVNRDYVILTKTEKAMRDADPSLLTMPTLTGEYWDERYYPGPGDRDGHQEVRPGPAGGEGQPGEGVGIPVTGQPELGDGEPPAVSPAGQAVPSEAAVELEGEEVDQLTVPGIRSDNQPSSKVSSRATPLPSACQTSGSSENLSETVGLPERQTRTRTGGAGQRCGVQPPAPDTAGPASVGGVTAGGVTVPASLPASLPTAIPRSGEQLGQLAAKLGKCKKCRKVLKKSEMKPHNTTAHHGNKRAVARNLYDLCDVSDAQQYLQQLQQEEDQEGQQEDQQ